MSYSLWAKFLNGEELTETEFAWPIVPFESTNRRDFESFLSGHYAVTSTFTFASTPQGYRYWADNGPLRRVNDLTEDELEWLVECLVVHHQFTREEIDELLGMA